MQGNKHEYRRLRYPKPMIEFCGLEVRTEPVRELARICSMYVGVCECGFHYVCELF
ncbi:hypothetical protein Hdeb2414_s0016g00488471 [Helianthus debilis subsp. tardiflorus]